MKILNSTYFKEYLEQVAANSTQMIYEEKNQLLRIFQDFEKFYGVTLGYWDKELVNLKLNPDYKLFHCKWYLVPRINKDVFSQGAVLLIENRSVKYGTTVSIRYSVFIITK